MKIRLAAAAFACLAVAPAARAEHQSLYVLVQHAIDNHFVPHFKVFETSAHALAKETAAFCADPSDAHRAALRARFKSTALAWAEVEYLRMGPASEAGRHERIAFWPDPRGVMERQLRPVLANRDASLLEPGALTKQSASLQGLPALEVLLADETTPIGAATDDGTYRCKLAVAISGNVASLAGEIVTDWTKDGGWRDRMLRPGSDNASYHSASEAAAEVAKSLLTGLQLMLEAQVKPRLEVAKEGRAKSSGLPFRKLGYSDEYLLAGLKSTQSLYVATALDSYLPDDKQKFRQLVSTGFETLSRLISADMKATPKPASAQSGSAPDTFKTVSNMLGGIRRAIATEMLPAAEISLGFNELDGD